ncbi:MAG: GNAT family N-acetyltransferase [Ottowia sp.]|nr:GNAT family N-acetyltransferase [Ottowia sp.]
MTQISIGNRSYHLNLFDYKTHSKQELQQEQATIFGLLVEREKEFSFNPDIITEYPDITDFFLSAPASYIQSRIANIEMSQNRAVDEVIILTTYGDKLTVPLAADGYDVEKIDMPAGPDYTFKFSKTNFDKVPDWKRCTLYLEAVNEQDEKIQPTFVLKLTDEKGILNGGMCGSVREIHGERFAYISTVVVDSYVPKSAGSLLAITVLDYLKQEGVKCANLGTQTAGRFYEKIGFSITHRIVKKLRSRITDDGSIIFNDLVIMAKMFSV